MNNTGNVCETLDIFGATIGDNEIDNRPLPDQADIETVIGHLFDSITRLFDDCPLVQDLSPMLWGLVNGIHAQITRINRDLETNERTQARLRDQQDGSEVNDTALREAIDQGQALVARHNAFTAMFDVACREFDEVTGNPWQTRYGSRQKTKHLTAAMIDSRDFARARATKWTEDHLPTGPYVIFSGGFQFQDYRAIWTTLDRVKAKYPSFVMLHGNAPGADQIAALWADSRGITQIKYGLHKQSKDDQRAGFRRNTKMLDEMPVGVVTFPGNGVTEALKREARTLGIPVMDYAERQQRCGRDASSEITNVTSPETNQAEEDTTSSTERNETAEDHPDTAKVTEATVANLSAKDLIDLIGVQELADACDVVTKTVDSWKTKGIPAKRLETVLALATD